MPAPRFLVPAGVGEHMRDNYHYSQGVQVGDVIYVTGQGGWDATFTIPDDVHEQVRRAFANVATVLAEADATWNDVVDITSYHVDLDESILGTMVEQLRDGAARDEGRDHGQRRRRLLAAPRAAYARTTLAPWKASTLSR
jgi:enamine deaminase RidA (YjgF/YER057c/UK114 family)